ncbi:MAG: PAS domain-containing protein [Desulfocapsa sp.]|nr:PAS domain-containing protein [Desulfocapsa sp.]
MTGTFSLFALGFFVIFFGTIASESFFHTFLHPELRPLDDNHIIIGAITTFFSTLLLILFFFRTRPRQLSAKLMAEELQQTKEAWEKTFNTMTDFVSIHDKDFKVIKVNQALCKFLGKSSEEILGKCCYRVFHKIEEPYGDCPHKKALETGQPATEIINDHNLGAPLQVTCSPLFHDDGTFQGSVHIARVHETVDTLRKDEEAITPNCDTSKNKNIPTSELKSLRSLLPLCSFCKKIRNNEGFWEQVDVYIYKHLLADISHSICPECSQKYYPKLSEHSSLDRDKGTLKN